MALGRGWYACWSVIGSGTGEAEAWNREGSQNTGTTVGLWPGMASLGLTSSPSYVGDGDTRRIVDADKRPPKWMRHV